MASEGGWSGAEPGRHTFEFPADGDGRPAAAIEEAVTWFADGADTEPIGNVVDLDWLSAMFGASRSATGRSSAADDGPSLAFEYGGCLVTVEPGRFTVEPAASRRSPRTVGAVQD